MYILPSLLVAVSLMFTQGPALSEEPVIKDPKEWIIIGQTPTEQYAVLRGTIDLDMETRSVQFMLRTVNAKPIPVPPGKLAQIMIDNIVLLCDEQVMIVTTELQLNSDGEKVNLIVKPKVFDDPHKPKSLVTNLLHEMCPKHTEDKEEDENRDMFPDGTLKRNHI